VTFLDEYKKAIFDAVRKNRWDIYSNRYPSLIVAGSMDEYLIKEASKLSLNIPYVVLPQRELFRNSDKLKPKVLDQKVLDMSKSVKPLVKFFNDIEELEGFVPSESLPGNGVKVYLRYHPRFELDKTERKSHKEGVSYRHFVETLEKLNKEPYDKFQ